MSDTMTEPATTSPDSTAGATLLIQRWREIAAGVALAALLAVTGWRGYTWWHLDHQQSDRASAISVASAEVTSLISINASTSQADIDTLLSRATSDFKSQLGKQSAKLRAALSSNKVSATGSVISAGLVSYGDDKASVIVAATGTVKNKSTAQAQPRNYRLAVSLQKTGGAWLVSGLELVS
jgi:Mce-associated membrane protein